MPEPRLCPSCGYVVNAVAAATADRPPRAGDIGICLSCGAVLILDADGLPARLASEPEMARLRPEARASLQAAVDYIDARGPLPQKAARA